MVQGISHRFSLSGWLMHALSVGGDRVLDTLMEHMMGM